MARPLTAKGLEYLDGLPLRVRDAPEIQAAMHVFAREAERFAATRDTLMAGLANPANADERLMPVWERLLGITAVENQTLAQRQAATTAYLARVRAAGTGTAWSSTIEQAIQAYRVNGVKDPGFENDQDGGSTVWSIKPSDYVLTDPETGDIIETRADWLASLPFDTLEVLPLAESWQATPGLALRASCSNPSGGIVSQINIPAVGGVPFRVRYRKKVLSSDAFGRMYLVVFWLNNIGGSLGFTKFGNSAADNTPGVHDLNQTFTPPVGTQSCRIRIQANNEGGADASIDTWIDDIELTNLGVWGVKEWIAATDRLRNVVRDPRVSNLAGGGWSGSNPSPPGLATGTIAAASSYDPFLGTNEFDGFGSVSTLTNPTAPIFRWNFANSPSYTVAWKAGDRIAARAKVRQLDTMPGVTAQWVLALYLTNPVTGLTQVFQLAESNSASTYAAGTNIDLIGDMILPYDVTGVSVEMELYGFNTDPNKTINVGLGRVWVGRMRYPTEPIPQYFDGGTRGSDQATFGTVWDGTVNASESREYVPAQGTTEVLLPFVLGSAQYQQMAGLVKAITDSHVNLDIKGAPGSFLF